MPKPAIKSKTIWVNAITTAVAVVTAVIGLEWVEQYPQYVAAGGAAVGALNIVLRYLTKEPLE